MTLEDFVGETLTQHSFNMQLLAIFGLLALVLCAIGIYSVLAYSVKRGMKEIGLRLAFGATLPDVARHVVLQGMKPTLAGIGIGLLASFALGRLVASMIYGVSTRDLATFFAVTILLIHVSLCASLIPPSAPLASIPWPSFAKSKREGTSDRYDTLEPLPTTK
jgi:putative ABC transport system permease protein